MSGSIVIGLVALIGSSVPALIVLVRIGNFHGKLKANQEAILAYLDRLERHIDKAHERLDRHVVDFHGPKSKE